MNANLSLRLNAAIAFIEAHLADPLTLAEIAGVAHVSPFHFARLFRSCAGDSVMNYVRRRRLARAVDLLRYGAGLSVLDIAVDCGFGSGEALAHAFRKQFGLAPITYRRNAGTLHLPIHRRLIMSDTEHGAALAPTFEDRPAFFAIGCAGEFAPLASTAIGKLWDTFNRRTAEVPNRVGDVAYGICCPPGEGQRDPEHFTYIAAVQTSSLDAIPDGMTGVSIAANRYAVFLHRGGLGPPLHATMRYVFGTWLGESGLQACGPDLEEYAANFDPQTGSTDIRICVPVKPND